jgi:hypothetical protein
MSSFLQLEAERGFPYGQEALLISTLPFRSPGGKPWAVSVAIPKNDVLPLEKALRAAQLKPLSFSLGIAALQNPAKESSHGVLALVIGENTVDLQVTCGGGIVALRALDEAFESEGMQKQLSAEFLAREIKITLGQIPPEFREAVREVKVFGRAELARHFINEIRPRMETLGLAVELVERYPNDAFAKRLPGDAPVSPALSLAAGYLCGSAPPLEFLPPRVKPWQQWTTRFSSKKLVWAGAATGSLALLIGGSFLVQQWQLSSLQTKWTAIEPQAKELENLQQQIKRFRPWFDDSFRSLSILRKLTEAFPEDGGVTAKTLEIRELSSVTCSGSARDNQAFLKMRDQLAATKEISSLKVDQVRGKTPIQFTFNFQWGPGGGNEN